MSELVVDGDTIEELLTRDGWPCARITDGLWRSHFTGKRHSFPFYVRVDPAGFIHFVVVPYVRSPEDVVAAEALYARLLDLNHTMHMAKFSIDDDLDVVLSVEYPTHHLDKSEFTDALNVLSYYADTHYDELVALGGSSE